MNEQFFIYWNKYIIIIFFYWMKDFGLYGFINSFKFILYFLNLEFSDFSKKVTNEKIKDI